MKKYLMMCTGLMIAALLLCQVSVAQDKKEKSKVGENEEIIIKRKDGKNTKVTIEIKDDQLYVNGKPYDEYKDDDIIVRKRHNLIIETPRSPFRGQSGTLNFDNDGQFYGLLASNTGFLGVVTEESDKGARIQEIIHESAAEKAGLKKGDVITKIDDTKIEDPEDLTKAIRKHKPEEKITVTYLRDNKENKLTTVLGKRQGVNYDFAPLADIPNINLDWNHDGLTDVFAYAGRPRLGIKAQDTEEGKGVKVLEVEDESAAEKAGLEEDDIITEFDGKSVNSANDLAKAARDGKEKSTLSVKILRDGKSQTLEIKIPKKLKTTNL